MIPTLIVPTLINTAGLFRMLRSVTVPVGNIVIIDNGVCWPRGTILPVGELTEAVAGCTPRFVSVMPMAANLGVAGSWNIGIKSTPHSPWWLIASDDITFSDQLAQFCEAAATGDVTTADGHFSSFAVSERVVGTVGLFDEGLHPAYWEDNDYARRMDTAGLRRAAFHGAIARASTSQTLKSCKNINHFTFEANRARFLQNNPDPGPAEGWRLWRRRALGWDPPAQE